jgi:hypothetical protein
VVAPATVDVALGSTDVHAVQTVELAAEEKVPATHLVQELAESPANPGAHTAHWAALDAPGASVDVPSGQATHARPVVE